MSVSVRIRRRAPLVLTALAVAAIAFPLGALAIHQFADVPDSNQFHADIDALVDSGVTSGCGGGNYCPSGNVTRDQMAAFLNRLGALAPGKTPVVNAKTAQDADKLDGIDSTGFVAAGSEIVMQQMGGWGLGSNLNLVLGSDGTVVSATTLGTKTMDIGLAGPQTIGGVTYALQDVTVCVKGTANVTFTNMQLHAVTGTTAVESTADTSDTILSAPTCRTMTDASLNAAAATSWHVVVVLDFATTSQATLGTVTTTWVPAAG